MLANGATMKIEKYSAYLLLLTTMLAALGWIFSKETVRGLPAFAFISSRFILASLFLMPFCYKAWKQTALAACGKSAGVGVLLGSALLCWIHAIDISHALGQGAFIMSLSMLLVPLTAWVLFRTRPERWFWFALPFAVLGLALLAHDPSESWQLSQGQMWFGCAALMLALHFNVNSRIAREVPTLLLTTLQLFVTGVMAGVASAWFEVWPDTVDADIWAWFTASTLLATSLRYLMQTTAQKYMATASAAFIMILEPVWTVALSVSVYGERLTFSNQIGCGMILLALMVYRAPMLWRK